MNKVFTILLGLIALAMATALSLQPLQASDHDDGESVTKTRNLNLTDLYVFREGDQSGNAADNSKLVLIMNTNPRSLPRQQYFFSTNASYDFHITRVSDRNARPTGADDMVLSFTFGAPNASAQQPFMMTARDGAGRVIATASQGWTTAASIGLGTPAPVVNYPTISGHKLAIFAGLREDPFFFDVEQFFRVRAGAAGVGPAVGFRDTASAVDFTKGYNVNSIAVSVPIAFLQQGSAATTFDVWSTISLGKTAARASGSGQPAASSAHSEDSGFYLGRDDMQPGQMPAAMAPNTLRQVERLGRPAVNEGLILTNEYLNAWNSIPPTADLSAAAAPVRSEAAFALKAIGNSPERINALVGALLPDVMRIDTTVASPVGTAAYANALNTAGAPVAGRKLEDDVVDVTLTVLTAGGIGSDNVPYHRPEGSTNPAIGHQKLNGQTAPNGAATFPYLAPAN